MFSNRETYGFGNFHCYWINGYLLKHNDLSDMLATNSSNIPNHIFMIFKGARYGFFFEVDAKSINNPSENEISRKNIKKDDSSSIEWLL